MNKIGHIFPRILFVKSHIHSIFPSHFEILECSKKFIHRSPKKKLEASPHSKNKPKNRTEARPKTKYLHEKSFKTIFWGMVNLLAPNRTSKKLFPSKKERGLSRLTLSFLPLSLSLGFDCSVVLFDCSVVVSIQKKTTTNFGWGRRNGTFKRIS